jgi:hypothetical protein
MNVADSLSRCFVSGLMLSLMNGAKFCIELNFKLVHILCMKYLPIYS